MNSIPDNRAAPHVGLALAAGYARLPERFFSRVTPVPVARPRLIAFNRALAAELEIDADGAGAAELAALFAGNLLPQGGEPIAAAYAGHQFGQFVPQLGDGRAILLGEVRDRGGRLREIQLKGSGRTPYSRGGDGRAALGPVLREYLVSEAMHALGIPTTRSLAAVATGEAVLRDQALPGAVLTRVAASHVRVGTFEYFAARGDVEALRVLAEHVLLREYPDLAGADRPHLALLDALVDRQALLVARWMLVGFVHGVMNTDNTSVAGETIDYGPCAFIDGYDPDAVFSSIDRHGRYAYSNQPHAAQWNLARFAETLVPLIDPVEARAVELANAALAGFAARFDGYWLAGMCRKLGLTAVRDGDAALARAWLAALQRNGVDFTVAFRALADAVPGAPADPNPLGGAERVRRLFGERSEFDRWAADWRARLALEPMPAALRAAAMRRTNPAVIARNHQIERAIDAATWHDDPSAFERLAAILARPFDEPDERTAGYAQPPRPEERVLRTFCGT